MGLNSSLLFVVAIIVFNVPGFYVMMLKCDVPPGYLQENHYTVVGIHPATSNCVFKFLEVFLKMLMS